MKTVKIMFIMLLFLASFTFTACQKDTIWVYYKETVCSDKWGRYDVSDKEKIKNIKKHLRKQHIQVFKVEVVPDPDAPIVMCFACHCETGKIIRCEINEDDLPKAINEKFYK